jgi:hypothetical protein
MMKFILIEVDVDFTIEINTTELAEFEPRVV